MKNKYATEAYGQLDCAPFSNDEKIQLAHILSGDFPREMRGRTEALRKSGLDLRRVAQWVIDVGCSNMFLWEIYEELGLKQAHLKSYHKSPLRNKTDYSKMSPNNLQGKSIELNESVQGIEEINPHKSISSSDLSPNKMATPLATDINEPPPERVKTETYRIIRDTSLAKNIKALYEYKCQICNHRITLSDGSYYAEAHHIKPLGEPHNGPDLRSNILCLCPNHHAELDYLVSQIDIMKLTIKNGHKINRNFVKYHNELAAQK